MNREILFKAKRKDNGKRVEGYYVYCRKRHYILPVLNKAIGFDEREDEWVEVIPDTLCQFTGLTDKNGQKIWENDILELQDEDGYFTCEWEEDTARFVMNGDEIIVDFDNYWGYQVEVIGNVFDNAELLEVNQVKRFKCKKSFCVDNYDGDGFLIENSSTVIEEGKVYELDKSGRMMIGGKDHVHLDSVDDGSCLEITKGTLKECFELLEVE